MDNAKDLYAFWASKAFVILGTWIEAGLEGEKLLEWALELGGKPFLDVAETLSETRCPSTALGVRRKALVKEYDSWENTTPEKIGKVWSILADLIAGEGVEAKANPFLVELVETFHLSPYHQELICFLFLNQRFPTLDSYLEELSDGERQVAFELACPGAPRPHSQHFRKTELLRTSGLVEVSPHSGFNLPYVGGYYRLEQNVRFTLSGDTPGGFSRIFFRFSSEEPIPLDRFPVKGEEIRTLQVLLTRSAPSLIFFHGEPGTGKSELAKAIALSVGMTPAVLNFDSAHKPQAQLSLLAIASRFQDPARLVVIVDEADKLLNTEYQNETPDGIDKGILNAFFDGYQGKAIFISNKIGGIDRSVLRRFHYTMPFKTFGPKARQRVWNDLSIKLPVFSRMQLKELSATYQANPAQIRNALQISMDLKNRGVPETQILNSARGHLETTQKLLWGTRPSTLNVTGEYSLAWVNLDTNVEDLTSQLSRWRDSLDQGGSGLNLLFHGMPGTGKTLFGRYLASFLELPIHGKRGSDLVSPYVGETETNIRAAFDEAEGGILMIDEADTFFLDRLKTHKSWERSRTNEILQALESFRGMLIATTNCQQHFDQASFRRFTYKVTFLPLRSEQREGLVRQTFVEVAWTDALSEGLQEMSQLTAGDVATVQKRLQFQDAPSELLILTELKKEISTKDTNPKQIGFSV